MFELPPPADDGLFTPEVGPQSIQKHHFLRRYIDAFTTAMHQKPWAGGLHYLDLFAGAGVEFVRDAGLHWGSPLIAAQAPIQFRQLHLCEFSARKHSALADRLARFPQPTPPQLIHGDANVAVADVTRVLPPKSLSLAFLDPYGLHLDFGTLRRLGQRRVDLIIFFPDHLDALRNWEQVYQGDPDSNLDRVLGTEWLGRMHAAPRDRWAEVLGRIYVEQIRTIGYTHFAEERISLPNGRYLYKLIYCSHSSVGARIWRNVSNIKSDGQRDLFN